MKVNEQPFGAGYTEIVIETKQGVRISFVDYGARINQWAVPMPDGTVDQIILGHEDATHARVFRSCYGATIGRVAGRIANGQFRLKERLFRLAQNNGLHHLHGGLDGLDQVKWTYAVQETSHAVSVVFEYTDFAGHNGYPGNVHIRVIHTVTEDNEWRITYEATADDWTLFNPTNHVYINLNGNNRAPIDNHVLYIAADQYVPLDDTMVPYGRLESVAGTPFDLRQPTRYRDCLASNHPQIQQTNGFDHPFVLNGSSVAATISCPDTNRQIDLRTDRPAVVVFTHNGVDVPLDVWRHPLRPYAGIALETQVIPDAINQPQLGNCVLAPDELFVSTTSYTLRY